MSCATSAPSAHQHACEATKKQQQPGRGPCSGRTAICAQSWHTGTNSCGSCRSSCRRDVGVSCSILHSRTAAAAIRKRTQQRQRPPPPLLQQQQHLSSRPCSGSRLTCAHGCHAVDSRLGSCKCSCSYTNPVQRMVFCNNRLHSYQKVAAARERLQQQQ